ncbi:MAG: hypothetical protein KatS3mg077_2221 [Candidatus Binatia bacterium]|nr:MAG: hypothetical protein KatS3mg077_2221 [Candidatus Binatia bacterium]
MRLFMRGKWSKSQKRWNLVIPLPEASATSEEAGGNTRKAPLKKRRAVIVPLRRRSGN